MLPAAIAARTSLSSKFVLISSHLSRCCRLLSYSFSSPPCLADQSILLRFQYCRSMEELKQIQSQIFKHDLHRDQFVLNKLMIFCADPNLGDVDYAERVFDIVDYRCLFPYNLMIRAHTKRGSFKKAMILYGRLRTEGLRPDNFTYPFVMKSIGCLEYVMEGLKIHGFVLRVGMNFDIYVCNSLVDMYAALSCTHYAKAVFDEMPMKQVVSWNVMISGFVRCNMFKEAVGIFQRMRRESNLKPDEATIVSTLSACTALKLLELGRVVHGYVNEEFYFTLNISNALLDMYSKCGCLTVAREVFDAIPAKNVVTWTAMVSGYISCGQLDNAMVMFQKSPVKDVVLWTAIINGCVQFNRFDEALRLFQEMQSRRIKPDKFTLVSLLTGCAHIGDLVAGKWIHGIIEEGRIRIDAVVGTALIDLYAKCGLIDKSLEIFSGVQKKDTKLWTSIICGLAMNGQTTKALDLFTHMKEFHFRPDHVTFVGVLSACNHGGLIEEGWKHFNFMRDVCMIEPNFEHFSCLVDLLGRAGQLAETENLIRNIPKENNNILIPLYANLLSSCRIHGNIQIGERVAQKISEIESQDPSVQLLLSNIYAAADRWEDVMWLRRNLNHNDQRKRSGLSSIQDDVTAQEPLVGDANAETKKSYLLKPITAGA